MKNKIKQLIVETRELIDYKSRIFIINTLLLSILFIVMNFFTVVKYNLINLDAYLGSNIQIKLLLKDMVENKKIEEFEKELIEYENVDYHAYSAKELAIKALETKMNLNMSQRNPLKNSITIYTKEIEDINQVEELVKRFESKDIVKKVLFNKELVKKILVGKRTMRNLKAQISLYFTIPLFIFIYLVFKLNFISYERELKEKYKNTDRVFWTISPYFAKKILNILLAWVVALVVFNSFYKGVESLLYQMSPNINIIVYESLPKSIFINQLIISLIILVFSGMFIKIRGGKR